MDGLLSLHFASDTQQALAEAMRFRRTKYKPSRQLLAERKIN